MVNMYMYRAPFVEKKASQDIPDYLSSADREYEAELKRVFFQFAIKHGLIVKASNEEPFTQPPVTDVNGWIYSVNWANFRSMVVPELRQSIINRLLNTASDEQSRPIELVTDLYTRLGCLFDHLFLDMIVNRVMTSISLIPYDENDHADAWDAIHKQLPWLWCLIYLQSLIRTETVK